MGLELAIFPLLIGGASVNSWGSLKELHSISLGLPVNCHELVDAISRRTSLAPRERGGARVAERIAKLAALAGGIESIKPASWNDLPGEIASDARSYSS